MDTTPENQPSSRLILELAEIQRALRELIATCKRVLPGMVRARVPGAGDILEAAYRAEKRLVE